MVKSIVIVGGGSAGWMTASHLSKHLKDVKITLVESPDIPVIGVGESTVPPVREFLESLDLKEEDWMQVCNATYKSSICFSGFCENDDRKFWYPFGRTWQVANTPANEYWLYKYLTDENYNDKYSIFKYTSVIPDICEQLKTVKSVPGAAYAYHFDAGALGEFLKEYSIKHGINFVSDNVTEIVSHDNGLIKELKLKNGTPLEGDLFIDCTGFRSLLLSQHFNEPFTEYYDYLFNNSAVVLQLPYDDKDKEMISYTMCAAQSAGWIWTIPLYNRKSHGYVYCQDYISKDEAETELRNYAGVDRVKDIEANHINIRVGKHERSWVKNCVAIGLSSSFIEPLESTGLQIAQGAIDLLTRTLKRDNDYNCGDMAIFNSSIAKLIDNVRDFLVCHYALTSREDNSYWRDVKYNTKIPDSVTEKLTIARASMPTLGNETLFDTGKLAGFSFSEGWYNILAGMGHLPFDYDLHKKAQVGSFARNISANLNTAENYFRQMDNQRKKVKDFPSHYQYLKDNVYSGKE